MTGIVTVTIIELIVSVVRFVLYETMIIILCSSVCIHTVISVTISIDNVDNSSIIWPNIIIIYYVIFYFFRKRVNRYIEIDKYSLINFTRGVFQRD